MTKIGEIVSNSCFIHETACVDDPEYFKSIGRGTKIWHFCHIMKGAQIGHNCVLGQNCFVAATVVIGHNVKIQNNVSLYDGVMLADDVFVGPSAVFTNVINPRSEILRKDEYLPTIVNKGASIGANATIVCGNEIGKYAFVAAGAVVTRPVKPFWLVAGVPAVKKGLFGKAGFQLEYAGYDNDRGAIYRCPNTGDTYYGDDEDNIIEG